MKRKLTLALMLVLCLTALLTAFGCETVGPRPDNSATVIGPASGLVDAQNWTKNLYKDEKTTGSYEVASQINVAVGSYPVTWAVECADAEITVTQGEGSVNTKINVPDVSKQVAYTLIATLTAADGTTAEIRFERIALPLANTVKPVAGKQYRMYMIQNNAGGVKIYLNGEMDQRWFATSTSAAEAVAVEIEDVEGGFKMYFMKGADKTYISVGVYYNTDGDPTSGIGGTKVEFVGPTSTSAVSVWKWNEAAQTIITTVEGTDYILGSYSTNKTFGRSESSYILNSDGTVKDNAIGISQFVALFEEYAELTDAEVVDSVKNGLSIDAEILADFALPTSDAATITWASNNTAIAIDGANATVTRGAADVEVVLTATIVKGDVTATKEITVVVKAKTTYEEKLEDITFNFSSLTGKGEGFDDTKDNEAAQVVALDLFYGLGQNGALKSVGLTKVYNGNGQGGAYPTTAGLLKVGTGSAASQIVLTFSENYSANKVAIKCHDWYKSSADHPTNSNTVAVNGCTPVLAPYNETGAPEVMEFILDETSNVVTIDIANRVFIFEIVVYHGEKIAVENTDADIVAAAKDSLKVSLDGYSNFELPVVAGDCSIAWTLKEASTAVTLDGAKVALNRTDADQEVVLVATISYGKASDTKEYTLKVAKIYDGATYDAPQAGDYNLALVQAKIEDSPKLYLNGQKDGNYLDTTTDALNAAVVTLEVVDGGYRMHVTVDGVKKYVNIHEWKAGSVGVELSAADADDLAIFTWNNMCGILVAEVAGTDYYFGTYNNFDTISASKTSYILNSDGSPKDVIGVSQFVLKLEAIATVSDEEIVAAAKGALDIPADTTDNITLITSYAGATITWASSNEAAIAADGTVTRGDADVTVTLTATIVCGEVTGTASFSVVVKAKPAVVNYVKVTSIAVGDVITLAYEGVTSKGETVKSEFNGVSNEIGQIVAYTDLPVGACTLEVVAGATDGSFAFKLADGTYLAAMDGNKLITSSTLDAASSFKVTFNDGVASIQNCSFTNRYLQYNISSPRFACYKGTQQSVLIYKYVGVDA